MSDILQIVHMAFTALTTLSTLILGWIAFTTGRKDKSKEDQRICIEEFQKLNTQVQVLQNEVDNKSNALEKIDTKLERLMDKVDEL